MSVAWPATLPQYVLQDGYSRTPGELMAETAIESGFTTTRQRFSACIDTIKCIMIMTSTQKDAFWVFYKTYCATVILFPVPLGSTQPCRFTKSVKPVDSYYGGGDFKVSFSLDVLP